MHGGSFIPVELLALSLVLIVMVTGYLLFNSRRELRRYKLIFDDLPNPVLRVDLVKFEPLACNRAFSRLLGYADNEDCISQFPLHPHLPQHNLYQIYRLCRLSGSHDKTDLLADIEMRNRHGEVVNQVIAVKIGPGERTMDLVLDQHKRGLADESFSRELLHRQNLLPYLKLDRKLNITSCNQAAQELFHLDHGVPSATHFGQILPAESRERLLRIYRKRLSRHGSLVLRHEIRTKESTDKMGQWVVFLDPASSHYHAFFRLESSNQLSSSSLYDLLDSNIGVWEMNWPAGRIYHNDAWLGHLGYDESHSISQLPIWFSLVSPTDRENLKRSIKSAIADVPFTLRYKFASQQGVELEIETRGLLVEQDGEGRPVVLRGIHVDLTHEKGKVVGKNFNHHLINNLTTILGYSEMIQSAAGIPMPVREFAERIVSSGEQMMNLLRPSEAAIGNLDKLAEKHGLSITGDAVIADGVSVNTLSRSVAGIIAFFDGEGTVASQRNISTSAWHNEQCSACADNLDESYFTVTVTDTGLTVDREHFKHILTPGFSTTSFGNSAKLLEVSNYVHKHGGHIMLAMGKTGFSTTLLLPVTQQARPAVTGKVNSNILIIDDEPMVANYLKEIVQRAGYAATVFTDAEKALAQFKDNPGQFDLVITDQSMPGLSGDVVMQTMLEQRPELPIIMCTGFSDTVGANAALELGAAGYVTKPIKVSHLMNLVENALAGAA